MTTNLFLTISRTSQDEILLSITDKPSRIRFVEARLSLEDFARLITGVAEVKASANLGLLENVGKQYVKEFRQATYRKRTLRRKLLSRWLRIYYREEGWILDSYLGAQNSICFTIDRQTQVNYSVYKYVDKEENTL